MDLLYVADECFYTYNAHSEIHRLEKIKKPLP